MGAEKPELKIKRKCDKTDVQYFLFILFITRETFEWFHSYHVTLRTTQIEHTTMNLNLKYGACIFKFIENVKEIKKKKKERHKRLCCVEDNMFKWIVKFLYTFCLRASARFITNLLSVFTVINYDSRFPWYIAYIPTAGTCLRSWSSFDWARNLINMAGTFNKVRIPPGVHFWCGELVSRLLVKE